MRIPAHPGLYDVQADTPTLNGTRCAECGRVYFPPLAIGCEVCGATGEQILPMPVAARGTIHSFAEVHLHGGQPPAPFIIGEIRLDDGPLVRAVLDGGADRIHIGDAVSAAWAVARNQDDGDEVVEPVFVTTSAGSRS